MRCDGTRCDEMGLDSRRNSWDAEKVGKVGFLLCFVCFMILLIWYSGNSFKSPSSHHDGHRHHHHSVLEILRNGRRPNWLTDAIQRCRIKTNIKEFTVHCGEEEGKTKSKSRFHGKQGNNSKTSWPEQSARRRRIGKWSWKLCQFDSCLPRKVRRRGWSRAGKVMMYVLSKHFLI